jgi:hypothetical protein
MIITVVVMKEWKDRPYKSKQGAEVVPHVLTCLETGESPMLQLLDYVLSPDELGLFGTLHGKPIKLRVASFRNVFGGRARIEASLVLKDGKPA